YKSQNLASGWLDSNQSTTITGKKSLGQTLQPQIKREAQIKPSYRFDPIKYPHRTSRRCYLDFFEACLAVEFFLPSQLDALFTNHRSAPLIAQPSFFFETLFIRLRNAAYITNHVRGGFFLRVFTHPSGLEIYPRKAIRLSSKPRGLNLVEVFA